MQFEVPHAHAVRTVPSDIRAQIDAFVAAGRVTRLPATDARILPRKRSLNWDQLGGPSADGAAVVAAVQSQSRAPRATSRSAEGWPSDSARIVHVGPCESAPGSKRAARYQLWRVGMTVREAREAGARLSDLRRDQAAGRILIEGE